MATVHVDWRAKKKSNAAIGLWRMFPRCWEKEPGSRISVSKVLDLLGFLWVLNQLRWALSIDSLYGTSPQQRSGASYNLEKVSIQEQDQSSQDRIDELDKGCR